MDFYLLERKTPIPLGSGMKANALRWKSSFQKGGAFRLKRISGSILKEGNDRTRPTGPEGVGLAKLAACGGRGGSVRSPRMTPLFTNYFLKKGNIIL